MGGQLRRPHSGFLGRGIMIKHLIDREPIFQERRIHPVRAAKINNL